MMTVHEIDTEYGEARLEHSGIAGRADEAVRHIQATTVVPQWNSSSVQPFNIPDPLNYVVIIETPCVLG